MTLRRDPTFLKALGVAQVALFGHRLGLKRSLWAWGSLGVLMLRVGFRAFRAQVSGLCKEKPPNPKQCNS